MSELYLFTGTDPNDLENDCSLLVSADTPEEAFGMWAEYFFEADTDDAFYQMPMVPPLPASSENLQIWLVRHDPSEKGPLTWSLDQCTCVGQFEAKDFI